MATTYTELTKLARGLDGPELRGALGFPLLGELVVQRRAGEPPFWQDGTAVGGVSSGFGVVIEGTTFERFLAYDAEGARTGLLILANGVRSPRAFLDRVATVLIDQVAYGEDAPTRAAGASETKTTSDGDRGTQDGDQRVDARPVAPDFRPQFGHDDWISLIDTRAMLGSLLFILTGNYHHREAVPGEAQTVRFVNDAEHHLDAFKAVRVGKSAVHQRAYIVAERVSLDLERLITRARASKQLEAA